MPGYRARKYTPGSAEPEPVLVRVEGQQLLIDGKKLKGQSVPLEQMELAVGGQNRDSIKIRDSKSGLGLITAEPALVKAIALSSTTCAAAVQARAMLPRLEKLARLRTGLRVTVVSLVIALAVLAYKAVDWSVDLALDHITPEFEEQIGKLMIDEKDLDTGSRMAVRVGKIGQRLVSHIQGSKYKFHFYVRQDPELNAFTYPGGNIVVLSELINKAGNDDEIAGVLAHEIGHVLHRDTLKESLRSAGFWLCIELAVGGRGQSVKGVAEMLGAAQSLERLRFSRQQEAAADLSGVDLMAASGYDPEGLINFFKRLEDSNGGNSPKLFAFIYDHPMPEDRIAAIQSEIKRLKH